MIKPMLAELFENSVHDIEEYFSASESNFLIAQPKLDGVRAIATKDGLYSRNGKPLAPNFHKRLQPFFKDHPEVVLDGELYVHGQTLQQILSLVKLDKADQLKFWAFDLVSEEPQYRRLEHLMEFHFNGEMDANSQDQHSIHLTTMATVRSLDEIAEKAIDWMAHFEGLMLRHPAMPYKPGRSLGLLKLKPWETEEGILQSLDKAKGVAKVLIADRLFLCQIAGRRDYWNDKDDWGGELVTVKFQKTPWGELRNPVMIAVRDYE